MSHDSSFLLIKQVEQAEDLEKVLHLERTIFEQNDFVSMDHYEKYLPQSVFFAAFDAAAECVGMVRLIKGGPILPPLLNHDVVITDSQDEWKRLAEANELWEFATMAVDAAGRTSPVFLSLVGACYRFAHESGVRYFGAIMDPKRAELQNRAYSFTFRRVGPFQHYMNEPILNAPYVLSFDEQDDKTLQDNPAYLKWLLHGRESDVRYRPPRPTEDIVIDLRD